MPLSMSSRIMEGELVAGPSVQTNLLLQFGTRKEKNKEKYFQGGACVCTSGHL
jgi:hypothetical protein